MNRSIAGTLYHVAIWPIGLAILFIAISALLRRHERRSTMQNPTAQQPPGAVRGWLFIQLLATLLLLGIMPPALLGGLFISQGEPATSFTQVFVFLIAVDLLVVIAGAVVVMAKPPHTADSIEQHSRPRPLLRAAAGILGTLCALVHAWSILQAGSFPTLARNSCTAVQTGIDCPFQVQSGRDWKLKGSQGIRFDKAGSYSPIVRLRRGFAEIESPITVAVGDDRGSPLFSPRVGDVWRFERVHKGQSLVLLVIPRTHEAVKDGGLTVRVTRQLVAHGRRWLRLDIEEIRGDPDESRKDEPKKEAAKKEAAQDSAVAITWAYFHNGQTYLMPGSAGGPAWWKFDEAELAVYRPDIDPKPPQRADGRTRRSPSEAYINSPIVEHSVPCEFRLFGLGCRCAERGLGPGRTLPGPAYCRGDSNDLASIGLAVLTAFTVLSTDRTDLVLTESYSATGLPPPKPPLVDLPSQEEYLRQQQAKEQQRVAAIEAAYRAQIAALFEEPSLIKSCLAVGTQRGSGRAKLTLFIRKDGTLSTVLLNDAKPWLPAFQRCVPRLLDPQHFPPPPDSMSSVALEIKY